MKTRTYAEILARQGELEEAIAIYRQLIAQAPDDERLARRAAELERALDEEEASSASKAKPASVQRLEALLQRIQSRSR